jgi:hypothetical protein
MVSRTDPDSFAQSLGGLKLVIEDRSLELPDWAIWLVWLGQWMRDQVDGDGRRVAVIRLPTRRTAAAFTTFGILMASARLHDDTLDWEALKKLPAGTRVYWRENASSTGGKSSSYSGHVLGLQLIGNQQLMAISLNSKSKSGQATRLFSKNSALGYGVTLGAITAKADAQLLGLGRVVDSLIDGFKVSWLRTPKPECLILSERTSFMADLEGLSVSVQGSASEPFNNLLSLTDAAGSTHGKTRLISPRQSNIFDTGFDVAVLDGASALLRLSDTTAKSVIALVDRVEYDEEVEQLVTAFMGYRRDEFVKAPTGGVRLPPPGFDLVVFGLDSGRGERANVTA